jgi:hypothetical protein
MGVDYVWLVLFDAMGCLVGDGDIRQRLEDAMDHLLKLQPTAEDFKNQESRDRFTNLRTALTAVPGIAGEGSLAATIKTLSTHDAERWAREILELFVALTREKAETD